MSAYAIDVGTADFKEKVLDASMTTPVVVDFWAEWCGPCKVLKPILEKLAEEYGGRFILAKVNSDEHPELAGHFGVRSIPTVAALVGGQIVDGFTGAKPEGQIREFLERFVPPGEAEAAPSLLEQARTLREAGDKTAARALLDTAIATGGDTTEAEVYLAKTCIEDGQLDDAEQILANVAKRLGPDGGDFAEQLHAMIGRVQLMRRSAEAGTDVANLETCIAAEPDNHALRLQLADALAGMQNWRGALEHLLISVKKDRSWNEEAARKAMLNLFTLLGTDENQQALVREFRTQLARTLN